MKNLFASLIRYYREERGYTWAHSVLLLKKGVKFGELLNELNHSVKKIYVGFIGRDDINFHFQLYSEDVKVTAYSFSEAVKKIKEKAPQNLDKITLYPLWFIELEEKRDPGGKTKLEGIKHSFD